ncbi:MAG TPA: hypothetical protein VFB20_13750 [Burkholderiales bacterium]|nr:hypothetical protein [Burkholderiales bacterium]
MISKRTLAVLFAGLGVASFAGAEDDDLAQGEKLYGTQCQLCHGSVAPRTGQFVPNPSVPRVLLAMLETAELRLSDLAVDSGHAAAPAAATDASTGPVTSPNERVAVALPYGPSLRGVVGRPAGTVPGYSYSSTFVKTLKGMEWTEAALNVWITNPQAWVPGVYMFYKQPNPDVRRKIILYLKANS